MTVQYDAITNITQSKKGSSLILNKIFHQNGMGAVSKLLAFAFICFSILASANAYAACTNISVSSRGGPVGAGENTVLYSQNVTCIGYQEFKLENLTGNNPRQSFLLEYQYRDGGTWRTVSYANGYTTSATIFFRPAQTGSYRLLLTNESGSTIRSYSLTGSITGISF